MKNWTSSVCLRYLQLCVGEELDMVRVFAVPLAACWWGTGYRPCVCGTVSCMLVRNWIWCVCLRYRQLCVGDELDLVRVFTVPSAACWWGTGSRPCVCGTVSCVLVTNWISSVCLRYLQLRVGEELDLVRVFAVPSAVCWWGTGSRPCVYGTFGCMLVRNLISSVCLRYLQLCVGDELDLVRVFTVPSAACWWGTGSRPCVCGTVSSVLVTNWISSVCLRYRQLCVGDELDLVRVFTLPSAVYLWGTGSRPCVYGTFGCMLVRNWISSVCLRYRQLCVGDELDLVRVFTVPSAACWWGTGSRPCVCDTVSCVLVTNWISSVCLRYLRLRVGEELDLVRVFAVPSAVCWWRTGSRLCVCGTVSCVLVTNWISSVCLRYLQLCVGEELDIVRVFTVPSAVCWWRTGSRPCVYGTVSCVLVTNWISSVCLRYLQLRVGEELDLVRVFAVPSAVCWWRTGSRPCVCGTVSCVLVTNWISSVCLRYLQLCVGDELDLFRVFAVPSAVCWWRTGSRPCVCGTVSGVLVTNWISSVCLRYLQLCVGALEELDLLGVFLLLHLTQLGRSLLDLLALRLQLVHVPLQVALVLLQLRDLATRRGEHVSTHCCQHNKHSSLGGSRAPQRLDKIILEQTRQYFLGHVESNS